MRLPQLRNPQLCPRFVLLRYHSVSLRSYDSRRHWRRARVSLRSIKHGIRPLRPRLRRRRTSQHDRAPAL